MLALRILDKFFPPKDAFAHCDIPCGIYDPHLAQVAAHTVLRMVLLIEDLEVSSLEPSFEERKKIISQVSRLTAVKEEHAELVKHEVRIIWGDFFKDEHVKKNKTLHSLVFEIMKLSSASKQVLDRKSAESLLERVQKFSELFWKAKGRKTVRIKSGYPTEGEIVVPK